MIEIQNISGEAIIPAMLVFWCLLRWKKKNFKEMNNDNKLKFA